MCINVDLSDTHIAQKLAKKLWHPNSTIHLILSYFILDL